MIINYRLSKLILISLINFQADCEWTIMTTTVFKSHQISFKLNETKNDITMDGRGVKFVMTQQKSNQWIEIQNGDNNKTTIITRNFLQDRMQIDLFIDNVTATSIFKRR